MVLVLKNKTRRCLVLEHRLTSSERVLVYYILYLRFVRKYRDQAYTAVYNIVITLYNNMFTRVIYERCRASILNTYTYIYYIGIKYYNIFNILLQIYIVYTLS